MKIFWGYAHSHDFQGELVSAGKVFAIAPTKEEALEMIRKRYAGNPYTSDWNVNNLTELELVKGISLKKHVEILRRAGEIFAGLD